MRSQRSLLILGLTILFSATLLQAQITSAEGAFQRSLNVSGPVDLDVSTGSGSITVREGTSGKVEIHGTIKARRNWLGGGPSAEEKVKRLESDPPIEQTGNSIRIGRIEDEDLRRNVSISYDITVPADTSLRSKTGSGSQNVMGLNGTVDASTGSGSVTLAHIGATARISTGSGTVRINNVKGRVDASTGSGSIEGSGIAGAFRGSTGSGSIRLQQTAPGDVEVSTGSGSVELDGVKGAVRVGTGSGGVEVSGEPTGRWSLHAGSGSVVVRLPAGTAFDLDARTDSGSVTADHPVTVQGTMKRGEMRGKVRGGGQLVELRTGSGNIRIR